MPISQRNHMATRDSKDEKKKKHTFWLEELKTSQVNLKIQRGGMLWPVLQSTTDLPVLPPSYRRIGLNSLGFHLEK